MTEKEAKKTNVFVINYDTNKIKKVNLAEFILESTDETTTPRGVGPRTFVEKIEIQVEREDLLNDFDYDKSEDKQIDDNFSSSELSFYLDDHYTSLKDFNLVNGTYCLDIFTISSWGVGGNNYKKGTEYFFSEENADNELFQRVWKYDFEKDDQRNTMYYMDVEDAQDELVIHLESEWGCSEEVVKHILRKTEIVSKKREEEKNENLRINKVKREIFDKEILRQSQIFSTLIDKIEGEKYKETSTRLSSALSEKISSKVFHKAVKLIRSR